MPLTGGRISAQHLAKMVAGRKRQAAAARRGHVYVNAKEKKAVRGAGVHRRVVHRRRHIIRAY